MTRILVIGGSQGIGLAVCRLAVARGHAVRAMSRRGGASLGGAGSFEVVTGDALRAGDVARALDGVDVVVQALGVPPNLDLVLKRITLFSEATRILLPAMQSAGVRKLIAVTGFGAGDSRASMSFLQQVPFNLFLKNAYDDKSIQEAMIKDSPLDWLIVRPGVLVDCAASSSYRVLMRPDSWRNGIVARADVADFIVKRIEADQLNRETPVIVRYAM